MASIVLVCGGRAFSDYAKVCETLDRVHREHQIARVVHGAALGADTMGGAWAAARGIDCVSYPADWEKFRRSAGPRRNQQMLDAEQPDIVVAFPGGRGTADMVRRAEGAECVRLMIKV